MNVSDYFREQMYAETTSEVVVILVSVTHPSLDPDRYFSTDPTQRLPANAESELRYGTISRGRQYDFLPMTVTLPDDVAEQNTVINLVLDNVSRAVTPLLRQTRTPATVKLECVLASRPDVVEFGFSNFKLKTADIDVGRAMLGLSVDALMSEPFPADNFTPSAFPGLWAST